MNFEDDLKIDEDSLNMECIRQPKLYMQYAEQVAEAERALNNSKLTLDVARANTDSDIRKDAKEKGEKVTEAIVATKILADECIIKQMEVVNNYRKNYSILQSAVKAMDHKKTMINNLVSLWIGSYFSTPTNKKEVTEEGNNKMQDRIKEKLQN